MDVVLLIARLALAGVFLVAGLAKLADRDGSRRASTDFGIPDPFAGAFGVGLPLVELAVAFALVPTASAVWGALAALVLLVAFCVAIGVNMARGRAPDCHCFGALHSEPAGWRTLARNAVLAAAAAVVVGAGWNDPGLSAVAWIGRLDTSGALAVAALTLAVAVAAGSVWFAAHLLQAHGRLLVRLDELQHGEVHMQPKRGLPVGAPAPAFELDDVGGKRVSLDDLLAREKPVLLVFTDLGCGPCELLMPTVAAWQHHHTESLTVAAISAGDPAGVRAKAQEHGLGLVLSDESRTVFEAYDAKATPAGVLVSADGTIETPLVGGADPIAGLVGLGADEASEGPGVGSPLPDLQVRTLDGGQMKLHELAGARHLILLWNPDCSFCSAMRDDLRAWEESRGEDAPELVVISSGNEEATRADGFRSIAVVDEMFTVGQALNVPGTPAAILLDADGRVAAPLAVGAPEVLALAGARELEPAQF